MPGELSPMKRVSYMGLEMVHWLRALVAFPRDLSFIPNTYLDSSGSRASVNLVTTPSCGYQKTYSTHTHTHMHTLLHKIIKIIIFFLN